ncbi:MAG: hypothetical protein AAF196_19090 [Planctomycetota bacterium]
MSSRRGPGRLRELLLVAYWVAVFSVLATVPTDGPAIPEERETDWLRLVVLFSSPLLLLAVELACRVRFRNVGAMVFRRIVATLPIVLGLSWLFVFGLTDYRSHRREVGLLCSAVALSVGFFIAHFRA